MRVLFTSKYRKTTFALLILFAAAISFLAAPTAFQKALGLPATSFISGLLDLQPAHSAAPAAMPLAIAPPPSTSIELEQCHNFDSSKSVNDVVDCSDPFAGGQTYWGSGNAQFSNARLHEGDNQNYRAIIKDLPVGTHTLEIELDLTKGGQVAYDYYSSPGRLMTATNSDGDLKAGPLVTPESVGIRPCQNNNNANAFCTAGSGVPFAIPAYFDANDGVTDPVIPESAVHPGFLTDLSQAQIADNAQGGQHMFLYGNATLAFNAYTFSGSVDGDSSVKLTMTINKTGGTGNVVLAWGARVSLESDYANSGKSTASDIEGSPYHMRLKTFSALQGDPGNQDMQMASSAIIAEPAIDVEKTSSVSNICNGTSTSVTYTYVVTNNGNVPLTVNLSDDLLGDIDGGSGFSLAVGASQAFTKTTSISQTTTNTVTATGVESGGASATDTDTVTVTARTCTISLTKTPSVTDICNGTSTAVTYTYVVTNTGDFFNVSGSVTDNLLGNIGNFGPLAPGASATLTTTANISATTTNTGTATGTFTDSVPTTKTATATATVTARTCTIGLTKTPSVTDVCGNTNAQVTYTYVVTNTGDFFSASGSVTDDILGSIGNFGPLAPGASATLTKVGTINSTTTNTGTASATFADSASTIKTATATATVTARTCSISLTKTPSVTNVCGGSNTQVTYTYVVSNTGDFYNVSGSVTDDVLGSIGNFGPLAPGQSATLTKVATINATTTNSATATGTFADATNTQFTTPPSTATVTARTCTISLTKTPNVNNICNGTSTPVTYTYVVTNTGDFFNVSGNVTDNVLGSVGSFGPLAPGQSATLTKSANISATTSNTGTATGTFNDSVPTTATATAAATVTARTCSISLTKTPNVTEVCENANTQVTYTYVVTNTGNFFNVSGSVTDNVLGSIGNFGPLAPGQSATLTKVATINSTTTNTGTATGTFSDPAPTTATATANATVTAVNCGKSQLTPTGNECPAFVAGTAENLTLTVNKAGKIAPGQFFYYTELSISGQTTIQHKVSSNPAAAADPTINTMKVFDAGCNNISESFSLSSVGNIATYSGNLGAGPTTIIIRTGYNTPNGAAGTIFTFETFVNNLLQGSLTESITVN